MQQREPVMQAEQGSRTLLRDLVAISRLPGLWAERTPADIAAGLAGVLLNTLDLEIVYISFPAISDQENIEIAYSRSGNLGSERAGEIRHIFQPILRNPGWSDAPIAIQNPLQPETLYGIAISIGADHSHGYVVATSRDSSFPDEPSRLVLQIAVNQAGVILRQKQVEEQLRSKQAELTDFFENASEGMHWVGPDGVILWANQAELDMLGYDRDEYIGRKFDEVHADPVIGENIMQRLVSDQSVHNYEARLRCKDGSIKHVLISSTVYRENGKFIHTRCFTRDITERKQMEEVLRKAYDETEMRVHFRTKELSAAIEALKDEIASRKRAQAEIAELRGRLAESREAERLLLAQELHDGPIQDLFALSYKLTASPENAPIPEFQTVQNDVMEIIGTLRRLCEELRPSTLISHGLETAIQSHLEQFKQQYPAYHIEVTVDKDSRLPERVSLALFRIYQQALANIVRHAQADRIVVGFRAETNQAVLEVRDDGRGFVVPEHWIDFARQGHLGLVGAIERAEAIGGEITVTSAPGNGTQIQVKVPLSGTS